MTKKPKPSGAERLIEKTLALGKTRGRRTVDADTSALTARRKLSYSARFIMCGGSQVCLDGAAGQNSHPIPGRPQRTANWAEEGDHRPRSMLPVSPTRQWVRRAAL